MDLEKLREKVFSELESLESVYQIIKDHNNYLKSQIERFLFDLILFYHFISFIQILN